MTTLIDVARDVAAEIQIPYPSSISGLTDTASRRFVRYANKVADKITREADWSHLRRVYTWIYGAEPAIPADFGRMCSETLWNETQQVSIHGPVTAHIWQLSRVGGGQQQAFTLRQGEIPITPTPNGGDILSYEYVSNHFCEDALGVGKSAFTADTDVPRVDADLLTIGIAFEWLAAEAQPFEAQLRNYRERLIFLTSQDNPTSGLLYTNFDSCHDGSGHIAWSYGGAVGTGAVTVTHSHAEFHDEVTLAGEGYLSITEQVVTALPVNLTNHVTDNLPVANLNSGLNASAATYWSGAGTWTEPAGGGGAYTDEEAQDAVGVILTDSASINFTYTDATPSITAVAIFGTSATTVCVGNDARLSDARTPVAHDHSANKLAQANTHETPDTDALVGSLHHTIGVSATQAAAGNHTHAGTYQPLDGELTAIAGLTSAADTLPYFTGAGTAGVTTLSAFGRTLIDDAANSNARTTLGLGTIATQAAATVAITGGSITNITDLAISDGGTGQSTAAAAFTALKQVASETATGVVELATSAETTAGLVVQASDTRLHAALTLAGAPDYITIAGQVLTRNAVDLAADVTGNLPVANLGSGTGASITTFWRGDNSWAVPSGTGGYTNEEAQDAVGTIFSNSDSISITYSDATPSIIAELFGDVAAPGNWQSYGTNGTGIRGWNDGWFGQVASQAQVRAGTSNKLLTAFGYYNGMEPFALTDAVTIAVDMAAGNVFTVTLAGNRTMGNPTNQKVGQFGEFWITQDATGNRTLAWASEYFFVGGTPVIATAIGAVSRVSYRVMSSGVVRCILDTAFAQPLNNTLTTLSGLSGGVGWVPYFTGASSATIFGSDAYSRGLMTNTSAADWIADLGLGTIATQSAATVAITGGSVTGITDLAIADGGTGASTAAAAFTALKQAATTTATGVVELATDGENAANVVVQGNDARLTLVTLAGTPDYITLSGQAITRGLIDVTTDITGTLPITTVGNLTTATETATSRINTSADRGNWVRWTSASAKTFTIADAVAAVGDVWQGMNANAAGNLTLAAGAGVTLTGALTFAPLKTYTLRFTAASAADVIGGT